MSDLRSLPRFSFGDIERYIKVNLDKVCGGAADNHMKNSMVNEKSFALHSEKGHILRITIKTDGSTVDIISNVKHSMAKQNSCYVKINFADINMPGKCNFTDSLEQSMSNLYLLKVCQMLRHNVTVNMAHLAFAVMYVLFYIDWHRINYGSLIFYLTKIFRQPSVHVHGELQNQTIWQICRQQK